MKRGGQEENYILKRFIEIKEPSVWAPENSDVDFIATSNPASTNRVTKYKKMLSSINVVTVEFKVRTAQRFRQ